MPWFSERYPQFYRRAEREAESFPRPRPDPRYLKVKIRTPGSVSALNRSFFDPVRSVKDFQVEVPRRFDSAEIQANRIRSELVKHERDRQIFAQWQRASDLRRFNPARSNAWPSNLFGAAAQVFSDRRGVRRFVEHSLPCVDRAVRREVMFAKKKAGRGYRKKHRRSWRSAIPC